MFLNGKSGAIISHNLLQGTSVKIHLKELRRPVKPFASSGTSVEIRIICHGSFIYSCFILLVGIVSITMDYGLDGLGSIPDRARVLFSLQSSDWLWGPPTSYAMGTGGSSLGGKEVGA
jgi:hypothetical protein